MCILKFSGGVINVNHVKLIDSIAQIISVPTDFCCCCLASCSISNYKGGLESPAIIADVSVCPLSFLPHVF